MTKLNSTQVFTGAGPVKIPLTIHFRAYDDPRAEVQAPIDQLSRWVLAQSLAETGPILNVLKGLSGSRSAVEALLPSKAPQLVGLKYGGYTFSPLIIESLSQPITVPRTSDGAPLHVQVQMTLSSLTALDSEDWTRARQGKPTKLFNN